MPKWHEDFCAQDCQIGKKKHEEISERKLVISLNNVLSRKDVEGTREK